MGGEVNVMGPKELGLEDGFRVPDGVDPSEIPDRLRAALTAAFGGGEEVGRGAPDDRMAPHVLIPRLIDLCERYLRSYGTHANDACPHKIGSLVHPSETSSYRGRDKPHIVLETRVAEPQFESLGDLEPSSSGWGKRLDMRVGHFHLVGGKVRYGSFWVESFEFEVYEP